MRSALPAALAWIDAALDEGRSIPTPSAPQKIAAEASKDIRWILAYICIDPALLDDTIERVNISLPRRILARLDAQAKRRVNRAQLHRPSRSIGLSWCHVAPSRCSAAVRVWLNSTKASTRGVDPTGVAHRGSVKPRHAWMRPHQYVAHWRQRTGSSTPGRALAGCARCAGRVVQHFLADLRPHRVQLARAVDRQRLPGQPDPAGDTGLAGQGADRSA